MAAEAGEAGRQGAAGAAAAVAGVANTRQSLIMTQAAPGKPQPRHGAHVSLRKSISYNEILRCCTAAKIHHLEESCFT
jgi:hypothetical protein